MLVITTVDSNEAAEMMAHVLVSEKLSACVSVVKNVKSTYRWEGKVVTTDEYLLILKTAQSVLPLLKKKLFDIHPYETPEFLVFSVPESDENYRAWIFESLK